MHPFSDGLVISLQTHSFDSQKTKIQSNDDWKQMFLTFEEQRQTYWDFDFIRCDIHPDLLREFQQRKPSDSLKLPPK